METNMDKLKLIKTAVFILTFLLIFGTLSLLGLFFKKTHPDTSEIPQQISLKQPVGSYVKEMQVSNDKLYILTVGGGLEDRVVVYDTTEHKVLTTIKIN